MNNALHSLRSAERAIALLAAISVTAMIGLAVVLPAVTATDLRTPSVNASVGREARIAVPAAPPAAAGPLGLRARSVAAADQSRWGAPRLTTGECGHAATLSTPRSERPLSGASLRRDFNLERRRASPWKPQQLKHRAVPCVPTTERYAKCIEVSKRIRWDIDRDVIRGRSFDFSKKFMPDGLSKVAGAAVPAADERALPVADPGPHVRQHVRAGRALHRRQDRSSSASDHCARRPGRARSAGALHRRGAQAPGAVPPPRADGGRACRTATRFMPQPNDVAGAVLGKSHLGRARR